MFTKQTLAYMLGNLNNKYTWGILMSSNSPIICYSAVMISPAQIRAARSLLGWKQTDLAEASGVSEISIKNIERGSTDARGSTLGKIEAAFMTAGVEFLNAGQSSPTGGPGVRLRGAE